MAAILGDLRINRGERCCPDTGGLLQSSLLTFGSKMSRVKDVWLLAKMLYILMVET